MPPAINLLLGLAGLLLYRRNARLALTLLTICIFSLYLLCTPAVSRLLVRGLEVHEVANPQDLTAKVDAIVVLGGGVYRGYEYDAVTVSTLALPRLRYAAYLHRETKLPILVTGGTASHGAREGVVMAQVLEREFHVPVKWVEQRSRNTEENAAYSADLLRGAGIERVALVTHAMHMPRSLAAFSRHGLRAVPAPIEIVSRENPDWGGAFFPRLYALRMSNIALHEYIGQLWYRLRY